MGSDLDTTLERGHDAEALACRHLCAQGLRLVERNFRCHSGELDLVMQDGDYLVFVEVRYRKNKDYGGGIESITSHKQRKLIRAASYYLLNRYGGNPPPARFDVIALTGTAGSNAIEWIADAFRA